MAIGGRFFVLRVEIIEKGVFMEYIYGNNKNKKLKGNVASHFLHLNLRGRFQNVLPSLGDLWAFAQQALVCFSMGGRNLFQLKNSGHSRPRPSALSCACFFALSS